MRGRADRRAPDRRAQWAADADITALYTSEQLRLLGGPEVARQMLRQRAVDGARITAGDAYDWPDLAEPCTRPGPPRRRLTPSPSCTASRSPTPGTGWPAPISRPPPSPPAPAPSPSMPPRRTRTQDIAALAPVTPMTEKQRNAAAIVEIATDQPLPAAKSGE